MSNDYFNNSGYPATGAAGTSAGMRSELSAVAAGFDKMAPLTGNQDKVVVVNGSGTGQDVADVTGTGNFVRSTSPTLNSPTLVTPALGTPASGDGTNLTNTVAPQTHAATGKATPVDADELPLVDSAASYGLKSLTWANLKATLKTYFDGLYATTTQGGKADSALQPVDAQEAAYSIATVGGTADAITLAFTPAWTALNGGIFQFVAASDNATTTTTGNPDGLGAKTFIKGNDLPLALGDIKSGMTMLARYDSVLGKLALLNPATGVTSASSSVVVRARQSILDGAAAFIQIGTGLACNLLATSVPVRFSFAAGMGANGSVDYVGSASADVASFWSGLTVSTTNYLFVDRNSGTGALTGIASTLPYIDQDSSAAISVVNGQHTYVTDTGQMYVGNGSTATAVQRTAVGQCVTGVSTVTSVTSYAKLGAYVAQTSTGTVPTTTRINSNHNIGVKPRRVRCTMVNINPEGGYTAGQEMEIQGLTSAGNTNVVTLGADDRLSMGVTAASTATYIWNRTTGALFLFNAANWATKFYAERGF
jgi:hypothetical protein